MAGGRPSDDLLLQMIREGKHDSEIAIRLGVTTGELRERKTDLRNRLGYERFETLTNANTAPARGKTRRNILIALAGVVGAFLVLLVVANIVVSDAEEPTSTRAAGPTAAPTARPALKQPAILSIEGEAFDDAGPFLTVAEAAGAAIGSIENRPGLTVVALHGTGFIAPNEFADWDVIGAGRTTIRIASEVGGRRVELRLTGDDQVTRLRRLADGLGPIVEASSQLEGYKPTLRLRVFGDAGKQLQARLTNDGRLYISRNPMPSNWVVDRESGRLVDTAGAIALATIVVGDGVVSASSFCTGLTSEPRCGVSLLRSKGMFTLVEGTLSCTGPTSLRFEAEGIRLDMSRGIIVSNANPLSCDPQVVPVGTRIVPESDWEILATTLDGKLISAGVTNDGTLLAGQFRR